MSDVTSNDFVLAQFVGETKDVQEYNLIMVMSICELLGILILMSRCPKFYHISSAKDRRDRCVQIRHGRQTQPT